MMYQTVTAECQAMNVTGFLINFSTFFRLSNQIAVTTSFFYRYCLSKAIIPCFKFISTFEGRACSVIQATETSNFEDGPSK